MLLLMQSLLPQGDGTDKRHSATSRLRHSFTISVAFRGRSLSTVRIIVCAFIGWTAAQYVRAITDTNASRSRSLRRLAINV